MTNAMTYKGYFARIDFDGRDNIFVGHVLGVDDKISFHGETVTELTVDFHAAVDHYSRTGGHWRDVWATFNTRTKSPTTS